MVRYTYYTINFLLQMNTKKLIISTTLETLHDTLQRRSK